MTDPVDGFEEHWARWCEKYPEYVKSVPGAKLASDKEEARGHWCAARERQERRVEEARRAALEEAEEYRKDIAGLVDAGSKMARERDAYRDALQAADEECPDLVDGAYSCKVHGIVARALSAQAPEPLEGVDRERLLHGPVGRRDGVSRGPPAGRGAREATAPLGQVGGPRRGEPVHRSDSLQGGGHRGPGAPLPYVPREPTAGVER